MRNPIDALALKAVSFQADRLYRKFLTAAKNATAVQDRVLTQRIAINADSDFGRQHNFNRIKNYNDFKNALPITNYDTYKPYIEQLKQGHTRAMFGPSQRLLMFALTSGTTDTAKFIPVTKQSLADYRRGWLIFGIKAFSDHPTAILRPILQITSPMDEFHTPAGTPCGAITGLMAKHQKRLVKRYYATPACTGQITDATARYYTIMRLAVPKDVAVMFTANPATYIRLATTANDHRDTLIRDIHDGTLNTTLDIPTAIRTQLQRHLRPNPTAAKKLDALTATHNALRPRDYWNLAFVGNWTGGTMGLYRQHVTPWFGQVPTRDIGLMASEARMSVPLQNDTPAGVLDFQSSFFEFVPEDQIDNPNPTILRAHQLDANQNYFLLLTTSAGLYRYDIRDLVRVTGHVGQAPLIEFLNKGAHVSSLAGEKLTERQVVDAAQSVATSLNINLDTFALVPHFAEPPFYTLHLEKNRLPADRDPATLTTAFDRALASLNIEYQSKRHTQRLAPIALNILPTNHLTAMDKKIALKRGRVEQFKHQYLYTRPNDDSDWPSVAWHQPNSPDKDQPKHKHPDSPAS